MVKRTILTCFVLLLAAILLGYLLLAAVYLIPVSKMDQQAVASVETLKEESASPCYDPYITSTQDNFTDTLMMLTACYPGNESILEKTALNYRLGLDSKSPYDSFLAIYSANGADAPVSRTLYERYWHGYLLALKPLLTVFSYSQIRIINQVALCMLLVILIFLFGKRPIPTRCPLFWRSCS